jgi:hypothetical protein
MAAMMLGLGSLQATLVEMLTVQTSHSSSQNKNSNNESQVTK